MANEQSEMDLMGKYVDLNISKMINNLIIENYMYICGRAPDVST